ncbi:DUF2218 domain-containing protein [Demequina capsici]|uniref:DUF2218 domain-containing protein n=1 Tax=Demequina capsici TaxID=3075620 RepID=A0AA96JAK6_9MICO|nr:DUF2218 domain-containing protein [Demequina sp. OYTSA14]WNM24811.1 DUF2218 domain-containing protein [Demequina sp. OYTSA14]
MTSTLTGRAATDRAARYAKQLCSHLGRKLDTAFDADTGIGTIVRGGSVATLTCTETALEISVTAPTQDDLLALMAVTQNHLERFGEKNELVCVWDDATFLDEYEALRAEMNARRAADRAAREAEQPTEG